VTTVHPMFLQKNQQGWVLMQRATGWFLWPGGLWSQQLEGALLFQTLDELMLWTAEVLPVWITDSERIATEARARAKQRTQ
jgi:hypothetical protein